MMVTSYTQVFGCKEGSFPFKYPGIPMNYSKLTNKDWSVIKERLKKIVQPERQVFISRREISTN